MLLKSRMVMLNRKVRGISKLCAFRKNFKIQNSANVVTSLTYFTIYACIMYIAYASNAHAKICILIFALFSSQINMLFAIVFCLYILLNYFYTFFRLEVYDAPWSGSSPSGSPGGGPRQGPPSSPRGRQSPRQRGGSSA